MLEKYPQQRHLPACHEAMVLCILAFPSLTVEFVGGSEEESDRQHANVAQEHTQEPVVSIKFVIIPESAPQKFQLSLNFTKDANKNLNGCISIETTSTGAGCASSDTRFQWESWRDAFEGRMQGLHRWSTAQGITNAAPLVTTDPITAGIQFMDFNADRYPYWAGWLPCTPIVVHYELWRNPDRSRYVRMIPYGKATLENSRHSYIILAEDDSVEAFLRSRKARKDNDLNDLILRRLQWLLTWGPDTEPCLTDEQLRQHAEEDVHAVALEADQKPYLKLQLYLCAASGHVPTLHALLLAHTQSPCKMGELDENKKWPKLWEMVLDFCEVTVNWDASLLRHSSFGLILDLLITALQGWENRTLLVLALKLIEHVDRLEDEHDLVLCQRSKKRALLEWVQKVDHYTLGVPALRVFKSMPWNMMRSGSSIGFRSRVWTRS